MQYQSPYRPHIDHIDQKRYGVGLLTGGHRTHHPGGHLIPVRRNRRHKGGTTRTLKLPQNVPGPTEIPATSTRKWNKSRNCRVTMLCGRKEISPPHQPHQYIMPCHFWHHEPPLTQSRYFLNVGETTGIYSCNISKFSLILDRSYSQS